MSIINPRLPYASQDNTKNEVTQELRASEASPRIRAIILLAGVVRGTAFTDSIQRSVINLPLNAEINIFQLWYHHVCSMVRKFRCEAIPLRVLVDSQSTLPVAPSPIEANPLFVERDPLEFRGTGGVLADATADYAENDYVIVGHAANVLLDDLGDLVTRLSELNADIAILADLSGAPAGLMLIRCGTLRQVPSIGFVDLNEQAMPIMAANHDVRVLRHAVERYGVHSLPEYIDAVRRYHGRQSNEAKDGDPWMERWRPAFGFYEDGSSVAKESHLVDSIVLRGAKVKAGAIVVRSVICPDMTVESNMVVVDQLVASGKSTAREIR